MSLERRGNQIYQYDKLRFNGKVISRYKGRVDGVALEAALLLAELDRERRAEEMEEKRAERVSILTEDPGLTEVDRLTAGLVKVSLFTSGYYNHKGQWRKRRGIH